MLAEEIEVDGRPLLARLGLEARSDDGAASTRARSATRHVTAALTGGPAAPLTVT